VLFVYEKEGKFRYENKLHESAFVDECKKYCDGEDLHICMEFTHINSYLF
jgi:hypothetical protein